MCIHVSIVYQENALMEEFTGSTTGGDIRMFRAVQCRIQANLKNIHTALTSIRDTLVVDRLFGCSLLVYDYSNPSMYKFSMQKEVEECKIFIVSDLIIHYTHYVYIHVCVCFSDCEKYKMHMHSLLIDQDTHVLRGMICMRENHYSQLLS